MTEHYSKTEKQYLSLTSVFKPFEQYSVYSDPDLPQIFSHNFVQLRASFPLNSLLSFLPSVSGLLNTNYIHLKASPQHTFPLVLKQSLVKTDLWLKMNYSTAFSLIIGANGQGIR